MLLIIPRVNHIWCVYYKGTVLTANFHSIFFDEEFWGDPHVFRPERFLLEDGNLDERKTERIIQFGAGLLPKIYKFYIHTSTYSWFLNFFLYAFRKEELFR